MFMPDQDKATTDCHLFMKGRVGAAVFAELALWDDLDHFMTEMCLSEEDIAEAYFEVDIFPLHSFVVQALDEQAYKTIKAWVILGEPSRAYLSETRAICKDALAIVRDGEDYDALL